jgi:hypothetical protein
VTTSATRRRRATIVGAVAVVAGLVAAGTITAVAASTLVNSREGRAAGDDLEVLRLPATSTALVGVVDDTGRLTSAVAMVLTPDGVGGSIVSLPATADSSLGLGGDRLPLAETLATQGPDAFRAEAEALTGISFDVAELVDAPRLEDLLAPLGSVDAELPIDVVDGDADEPLATAGPATLDSAGLAELLTAAPDEAPDAALEPAREAIWSAIASAVGAGVGTAAPATTDEAPAVPADLDAFTAQLLGGPVGWRGLRYETPDAERNPRGVDVVVPDRAEVALVFAQIAPARMGAPNPSLSFRIENRLAEDELAPLGVNAADVGRDVINRLLFVQANVISVVNGGGDAPDVTQVLVADESIVDVVTDNYPLVFGELEVVPAEYRIEGVDVIVILGRSYLELIANDAPPATLPSDSEPASSTAPDGTAPDGTGPDGTAPSDVASGGTAAERTESDSTVEDTEP